MIDTLDMNISHGKLRDYQMVKPAIFVPNSTKHGRYEQYSPAIIDGYKLNAITTVFELTSVHIVISRINAILAFWGSLNTTINILEPQHS